MAPPTVIKKNSEANLQILKILGDSPIEQFNFEQHISYHIKNKGGGPFLNIFEIIN